VAKFRDNAGRGIRRLNRNLRSGIRMGIGGGFGRMFGGGVGALAGWQLIKGIKTNPINVRPRA